jgi:hypothetical protein
MQLLQGQDLPEAAKMPRNWCLPCFRPINEPSPKMEVSTGLAAGVVEKERSTATQIPQGLLDARPRIAVAV